MMWGDLNRDSNSLFPTLQVMGCSRPSVGFAREIRGGKSSETEDDRNPFSVIASAKDGVRNLFLSISHYYLAPLTTVRLTSTDNPQIEGKFTVAPGGLTNVFYGCID
jgi:hypothetical protein